MNKKILIIICGLIFICAALSSCSIFVGDFEKEVFSSNESDISNQSDQTNSISPSSAETENSDSSKKSSNEYQTTNSSPKAKVEKTIVTDNKIKEPSNLGRIDSMNLNYVYTPVNQNSYYQLSSLSSAERKLYKSILETILASKCIVDVSKLYVSADDVASALERVLADYPQFFYISKSYLLVYGSNGKTVRTVAVLYTDGSVTDEFDQYMNLTKKADRLVINKKISAIKSVAKEIISKIPANSSDVIKERIIHDFIAKKATYDTETAKNIDEYDSHAYDLYGAAVEGLAVCEGYSKLFQYLCYSVGINSTQVIGTSNGGGHMWNTVLIDGKWYQVDLTWNDSDDIISYKYFNLTSEKISEDHLVDNSVLATPHCTSTEKSFKNVFAICIENSEQPPSDYESKISNMRALQDNRIYFYFEDTERNQTGVFEIRRYYKYISRYLINPKSDFWVYLSAQGLTLSDEVESDYEYIVLKCH